MNEQLTLFPMPEKPKPTKEYREKRNWENAFQRWSDNHGKDGTDSRGVCGYGSMCDYCGDNSKGRPCVRALNAMLKATGKSIDYENNRDFNAVWYEGTNMKESK